MADTALEVVSVPLGRGLPAQVAVLVPTVPPDPVPVEKQFTDPEVVSSSWRVPSAKVFESLTE
ncbi:MAG: hypothetical protein ACRDV6_03580 [Acidimicrobiales bacterium]